MMTRPTPDSFRTLAPHKNMNRLPVPLIAPNFFRSINRRTWIAAICSLVALGLLPRTGMGQPTPANLQELTGKVVDVRLKNDDLYAVATVDSIKEGPLPNSITSMKVRFKITKRGKQTERTRTVSARKIEEIFVNDRPLDVIYDKKNKCLVFSPEKRKKRLAHRKEISDRLAANGDRFWEPLSETDQARFLQKNRAFIQKVQTTMGHLDFQLIETRYFLFLTDMKKEEADSYIRYLDLMYQELCKAFGLSPEKNIWAGKCVVIAFTREKDYLQFEQTFMRTPASGTQGLCHQFSDGVVTFAGFRGNNGAFAHVLVHETAHGFVHRYRTTARAPSWLNEGMSDWLANVIVGGDVIPKKQAASAALIKQQKGWGDFLTTQRISGGYYGSASALIEILLARDKKKTTFRAFFNAIKEGIPADLALKETFKLSYQDLKILYLERISKNGR